MKVHLAVNRPGGTFVKTFCGRIWTAGSMGGPMWRYSGVSWKLVPHPHRCARCQRAFERDPALAKR